MARFNRIRGSDNRLSHISAAERTGFACDRVATGDLAEEPLLQLGEVIEVLAELGGEPGSCLRLSRPQSDGIGISGAVGVTRQAMRNGVAQREHRPRKGHVCANPSREIHQATVEVDVADMGMGRAGKPRG